MYLAYKPCFSSRLDKDNYLDVLPINGIRRDARTNDELKRTCASVSTVCVVLGRGIQ